MASAGQQASSGTSETAEHTSPSVLAKSFAAVCRGKSNTFDVKIKEPVTYKNRPTIIFLEEDIQTLAKPLKYALVGKMRRSPDLKTIKEAFLKLGLAGNYTIGSLHPGFILINLQAEEDYARLWTNQEWYLAGALFSIAKTIGCPLKLDEPTANRTHPGVARVCIELDLRNKVEDYIWIKNGNHWIQQRVLLENLIDYCKDCWRRGHTKEKCLGRSGDGKLKEDKFGEMTKQQKRRRQEEWRVKSDSIGKGKMAYNADNSRQIGNKSVEVRVNKEPSTSKEVMVTGTEIEMEKNNAGTDNPEQGNGLLVLGQGMILSGDAPAADDFLMELQL